MIVALKSWTSRPLPYKPVYSEDVELEDVKERSRSGTQQRLASVEELKPLREPSQMSQTIVVHAPDEPTNGILPNGAPPASLSELSLQPDKETRLGRAASLLTPASNGQIPPGRARGSLTPRGRSSSHNFLGNPDVFYPGSLRNISRDYESHRDIYRSLAILHQEEDVRKAHIAHHPPLEEGPRKRLRIRSRSPSPDSQAPGGELEHVVMEEVEEEESWWERAQVELSKMMSLSLLKDPIFLLFAISNFLTSMGFNIPLLYLPDKATFELRIDKDKVGFIVGAFGVSNTVGRILIGFVSDKEFPCRWGKDIKANRLWIYNLSLAACGVITAFNYYCQDFYSLVIYSTLFGFLISSYVCLTSVILVDLLGIDALTNAFGLLLLFQGVSSIVGPPIGGWIVDSTNGDYHWCFVFAGLNLLVSGLMLFVVPCLERRLRSPSFLQRRDNLY